MIPSCLFLRLIVSAGKVSLGWRWRASCPLLSFSCFLVICFLNSTLATLVVSSLIFVHNARFDDSRSSNLYNLLLLYMISFVGMALLTFGDWEFYIHAMLCYNILSYVWQFGKILQHLLSSKWSLPKDSINTG